MKSFAIIMTVVAAIALIVNFVVKYKKVPESDRLANRGNNAVSKKDVNKALGYYKKAYEVNKFKNTTKGLMAINIALCYMDLKDIDQALEWGLKATELREEDPNSWAVLGRAYFDKGDIANATECFEKKAIMVPNDTNVYSMLAVCYAKVGDTKSANIAVGKAEANKYPEMQILKKAVKDEISKFNNENKHRVKEVK